MRLFDFIKKFFKETFRLIGALLALARGIMILCMIIVAAITVYLIYVTVHVTINQYNETLIWEETAYNMPLSEIKPELVANTLDSNIVLVAAAWEDLDSYLENLDNGIELERETAEEILNEAVKWQEIYDLKSGHITRLTLYLELEDALMEVYETLNTEKLSELALALYNLELEETTVSGQQYMERLNTVTADFADAKSMITDVIGSIGTVENGVWTIPYTYTRTDLTEALEKIQNMQKFPIFKNSADVLSDIAVVLNYNKNAREYFEFQNFMETVGKFKRSNYIPVSLIYTYGQALDFGCIVNPVYIDGYTINRNSPVIGVYYNGKQLASDEYVRKGAEIIVKINEIYDPIPEPESEKQEFEKPELEESEPEESESDELESEKSEGLETEEPEYKIEGENEYYE